MQLRQHFDKCPQKARLHVVGGDEGHRGWLSRSCDRLSQFESKNARMAGRAGRLLSRKESEMQNLWLTLFWTGPIGIGVFLMGLGVLFWGLARLRKVEKK